MTRCGGLIQRTEDGNDKNVTWLGPKPSGITTPGELPAHVASPLARPMGTSQRAADTTDAVEQYIVRRVINVIRRAHAGVFRMQPPGFRQALLDVQPLLVML